MPGWPDSARRRSSGAWCRPRCSTDVRAWAAVAISATLFGLAHFLSATYAVIAALVGAYLGWLHLVSGNLLVPIVAHAVYDLVALESSWS